LTGPDLIDALTELGISKAEFASWTGVQWKTVHRWCTGELAVPTYAATILEREHEIRALHLRR
jgi:hypothetical protein